jgi:Icc-related predicted phosphoesterase
LHVGETTEKELIKASDYIRSLHPDYVISAGDFLEQELLGTRDSYHIHGDVFMKRYLEFLKDSGLEPEKNVFHVSGGVHDGWDSFRCKYYDGMFRKLKKYSDMDLIKIGNLAFIFLSEVRGGKKNYRVTGSQLDWLGKKVEELSRQGYNIFLVKHVKHTSLYRTTAYTDKDGDSGRESAWYGVDSLENQEESHAIKSIVNQYDNVIMIIQGHVHIDATDIDDVGRSAFMNWKDVLGDPRYLGIKAHVLNCAGISTTMHGDRYKSYQNIWHVDFFEGRSRFNLYAHDISAGKKVLLYKIPLVTPFESGEPKYEQQWSPCYLDYPKVCYPESLTDSYKIYVRPGKTTYFKAKYKFDEPVTVIDINLVKTGMGSITKSIAYSLDGTTFSEFSSDFPTESYKYWMVKVDVVAETQINIDQLELITG